MSHLNIHSLPLETQSYLNKARQMSHEIVHETIAPTFFSTTPVYQTHRYYHSPTSSLFNYFFPRHHHIHHYNHSAESTTTHREGKGQKKDNKQNAAVAGVALTALAALLLYSFGSEMAILSNAKYDLKQLEEDHKISLLALFESNTSKTTIAKVERIAAQQKDILEYYKSDSESRLLIKGAVTTGVGMGMWVCAKLLLQDIFLPQTAMIGSALAIGGGLVWAYKSGFDSATEIVQRKANDLQFSINNL